MRAIRFLLPVLVIALGIGIAAMLMATGPQAERRRPPPALPTVEVVTMQPTDYQVRILTRGTVSPRTESTLIPEVAGRVTEVAPSFRQGGFFEAGELLLKIDSRDYQNDVTVAGSELAAAQVQLEEEQARAAQARRDWQRLGKAGEPPKLVSRKPQLAGARAALAAAEARLRQARTNLERTRIVAPYAGRVLQKNVDVGQYVSPGTVLASIYAVDYVEIRLPLTNEQLEFVPLPESYRGEDSALQTGPPVTIRARIGQRDYAWQGKVVRTEGAIDTRSRQLFVVAQVDDPYARQGDKPPLKVGQFVEAEISGAVLRQVFVLPRALLRVGDEVLLVDADDRIQIRKVDVVWRDRDAVVVQAGLTGAERIAATNLPYAASGTLVRVSGEETEADSARRTSGSDARPAGNRQRDS